MAEINMNGLLQMDGQGNGVFRFAMGQHPVEVFVPCPTPVEVWDKCVSDDWPVHDSKALAEDGEIDMQRYNIQKRLELKMGPHAKGGKWTAKAWLEMRKWFGKARRNMAMIALPPPPAALAILPPPAPVAVPLPVQPLVPSPITALDEDEDDDEEDDTSDTDDSDSDHEEIVKLKARIQELEQDVDSTEQSRQDEEADHEETRGLLRHAEDMLELERSETKRLRTMLEL
jgi:hypothetical protein